VISVFIPGAHATATGAEYEIHHNGTVDVVTVDQGSSSGRFVPLDAFELSFYGICTLTTM
jgi:hypothetical protein